MLTHILRHIFRMRTYRILLVVVVEATLDVSVSICTKLSSSILMSDRNIVTESDFRKSLSKSKILTPKNSYLSISAVQAATLVAIADRSIAMTSRPAHWHLVDARPRPIAHKSKTNSRSITKIRRSVLHVTCYIAHQFQGQRSRSQAHIFCTSHLCLFLIRETKCCTCVIRGVWGHTVLAEPGGHTSCWFRIFFLYLGTC